MGCGPSKGSTQSTLEPHEDGFSGAEGGANAYEPPGIQASGNGVDTTSGGGIQDAAPPGGTIAAMKPQPSVPQQPATLVNAAQPSATSQETQPQQPPSAGAAAATGSASVPAPTAASLITNNGTANPLHVSNTDDQWKDLWEALSPHLLDPDDVTAVVSEVMNETTNQLLSTEVNFILRRVRHIVRGLPRPNNNFAQTGKMRVFAKNDNTNTLEAEGKVTAERHHLLSAHVFRRILGGPLDIPKPDGKEAAAVFPDPIEAAYLLLLHLSEPVCERAAAIATKTAKNAGLEMDVNKGRNFGNRPQPVGPSKEEMPDLPPGITVHSYAYLLAVALRK